MLIWIKNFNKIKKVIRPFPDRNRKITLAQEDNPVQLNLKECRWEIEKFYKRWLEDAGIQVVPFGAVKKKAEEEKSETSVVPITLGSAGIKTEENITTTAPASVVVNENVTLGSAGVSTTNVQQAPIIAPAQAQPEVDLVFESGKFEHFNPNTKQWQELRKVRDWVKGRIIKNVDTNAHYQVRAVIGDSMSCIEITAEIAKTIIEK